MSHAARIRAAERAFMAASEEFCIAQHNYDVASGRGGWVYGPAHQYDPTAARVAMLRAYEVVRSERAATCPTCGGTGDGERSRYAGCPGIVTPPCPSGCDAGRRRDA